MSSEGIQTDTYCRYVARGGGRHWDAEIEVISRHPQTGVSARASRVVPVLAPCSPDGDPPQTHVRPLVIAAEARCRDLHSALISLRDSGYHVVKLGPDHLLVPLGSGITVGVSTLKGPLEVRSQLRATAASIADLLHDGGVPASVVPAE